MTCNDCLCFDVCKYKNEKVSLGTKIEELVADNFTCFKNKANFIETVRDDNVNNFDFDYGVIIYKHRFNMTRSLDDYKETIIDKCIRISVELKYKTVACDKLVYEIQVVYKDNNDKLQCLCLDLYDWTIIIKHIGNMQCKI